MARPAMTVHPAEHAAEHCDRDRGDRNPVARRQAPAARRLVLGCIGPPGSSFSAPFSLRVPADDGSVKSIDSLLVRAGSESSHRGVVRTAEGDVAEGGHAVFVAARMEQGVAFARHLEPDRSDPAEQQAHLHAPSVLRFAVEPEWRH